MQKLIGVLLLVGLGLVMGAQWTERAEAQIHPLQGKSGAMVPWAAHPEDIVHLSKVESFTAGQPKQVFVVPAGKWLCSGLRISPSRSPSASPCPA